MDEERHVRDANARSIGPTSDATAIDRDIRGEDRSRVAARGRTSRRAPTWPPAPIAERLRRNPDARRPRSTNISR
jgi:hypothetical protein